MSNENQTFQDPKNAYLFKLINMVDAAAWELSQHNYVPALQLIATITMRIDINEENKELYKLKKEIVENYNALFTTSTDESIRHFFVLVSNYLNGTYFKGWNIAKPKYGSEGRL